MRLSAYDKELATGKRGPAKAMAMSIIVRMAEVLGAQSLIDITQAHIDSSVYMGQAGLEFAEKLAMLDARVSVPTTLNVSALDEHHWKEWSVPEEFALASRRQMTAYEKMGCRPIWTCAPYQSESTPKFGQQIAWGESNAIVFANSVIGARTERYPDFLDICAAITGRVPAVGLHLSENRKGQVLMPLHDIPNTLQSADDFYPVLGHVIGKMTGNRIPVITGLGTKPNDDQFKALGAAASASGTVALFHVVGHTPEAQTLATALHGGTPEETTPITMKMLQTARKELTNTKEDSLDLVILGSPHFSLEEFKVLAGLIEGKHIDPSVKFLVTSSRGMVALAKASGYLQCLEEFGGQVTVDTCILVSPMLPPEVKQLMTNSAKYAYYGPGLLETEITFGSLADCVESAINGRIIRDNSLWD